VNCNDVDGLIGAYALDALDADDTRAVREHLVGCASHAASAAELRTVAQGLAATVEPVTPPARLRSRIIAAVDAADGRKTPVDIATGRAQSTRRNPWAWAGAAAAAAIIVGLVAWNVVLIRRSNGGDLQRLASRAQIVSTLQSQHAAGSGVVLYFSDDKKALVVGDGMAALDPAVHTYQLWEINGGAPKSIGLMQADASGHAVAVVPFVGGSGRMLAITIEPAGGSSQPTTAPIFTTKI